MWWDWTRTGCIPACTWMMMRPSASGTRKSGFRLSVFSSSARRTISGSTVQAPAVPVQRYITTEARPLAAESPDVRWAATATAILRYGTMYLPSLIMTDMAIIQSWSIRILIRAWGWSVWLWWFRALTPCLPLTPTKRFWTGCASLRIQNTRRTMRQMCLCVLSQTTSSPVPS